MDLNKYFYDKKYYLIAAVVVVVFIIAVIVAFAVAGRKNSNPGSDFEVQKVDLNKSSNKLPEGFPKDIPVETAQPVKSEAIDYPTAKATQFTYSYLSDKSKKDKFNEYKSFVDASKYKITFSDTFTGVIYATKDNNEFSVSVTVQNGKTLVQITYLLRK